MRDMYCERVIERLIQFAEEAARQPGAEPWPVGRPGELDRGKLAGSDPSLTTAEAPCAQRAGRFALGRP